MSIKYSAKCYGQWSINGQPIVNDQSMINQWSIENRWIVKSSFDDEPIVSQ